MKIAYFGSPTISARLLASLYGVENINIKLVITQRNKPAGKQLLMTQTPVKLKANELKIDVFDEPLNQSSETELIFLLQKYQIELCIVFAYGEILSKNILTSVRNGFWNIHPSLLPKYRGASPIVYPIALGESMTGVTLIQMNEAMDSGDILNAMQIPINEDTTRMAIENSIIPIASNMIQNAIETIRLQGKLAGSPQNEKNATYTRRLNRRDGYISLSLLKKSHEHKALLEQHELPEFISKFYRDNHQTIPESLYAGKIVWNMYKALYGWPGIWTTIQTNNGSKRLKITNMKMHREILEILSVQLEGKKEVSFNVFNKSYNIFDK